MIPVFPRRCQIQTVASLVILGCVLLQSGCTPRTSPGRGSAYGDVIEVPKSGRWWHYYERALSLATAGDLKHAESDFLEVIALRLPADDTSWARTSGLRFLPSFPHRELGAVLLRQGRLKEAETELRLSLSQERSTRAEELLHEIHPDLSIDLDGGIGSIQDERH